MSPGPKASGTPFLREICGGNKILGAVQAFDTGRTIYYYAQESKETKLWFANACAELRNTTRAPPGGKILQARHLNPGGRKTKYSGSRLIRI